MSEPVKKTLYSKVETLTLEDQAEIQSEVIKTTLDAIRLAREAGDIELGRKLSNAINMQNKALTEIQRALMMQRGKGRKTRLVNDLTEAIP